MMHEGWNDPRSPYYMQGCENDEGRDHMSLTQPNEDCDTCIWFNESENYVPYGNTFVLESRIAECELGYQCDCPPEKYRRKPTLRDLEYEHADWLYDRMRDR